MRLVSVQRLPLCVLTAEVRYMEVLFSLLYLVKK